MYQEPGYKVQLPCSEPVNECHASKHVICTSNEHLLQFQRDFTISPKSYCSCNADHWWIWSWRVLYGAKKKKVIQTLLRSKIFLCSLQSGWIWTLTRGGSRSLWGSQYGCRMWQTRNSGKLATLHGKLMLLTRVCQIGEFIQMELPEFTFLSCNILKWSHEHTGFDHHNPALPNTILLSFWSISGNSIWLPHVPARKRT